MSKGFGKIQKEILLTLLAQIKFIKDEKMEALKDGCGEINVPTEWFIEAASEELYEGKSAPKYIEQVVYESIRSMEKHGWVRVKVEPVNKEYRDKYRVYIRKQRCPTRENIVYACVKDWKLWNPKQKIFYNLSL